MCNSGKAWALPPPQPTSAVQSTTGMSFLAIQQSELDRLASDGVAGKDKRSLREIQEEEAALQAEADFLAWWTAEEERIRLETQTAETSGRAGGASRRRGKGKAGQEKERGPQDRSGLGTGSTPQVGSGTKRRPRKSGQKGS